MNIFNDPASMDGADLAQMSGDELRAVIGKYAPYLLPPNLAMSNREVVCEHCEHGAIQAEAVGADAIRYSCDHCDSEWIEADDIVLTVDWICTQCENLESDITKKIVTDTHCGRCGAIHRVFDYGEAHFQNDYVDAF